jgi:hypothetical protein
VFDFLYLIFLAGLETIPFIFKINFILTQETMGCIAKLRTAIAKEDLGHGFGSD